jgi:hypothetical protein
MITTPSPTPQTIKLRSFGGELREANVLRIEPEGFVVRWGFQNFTLHVRFNQLVRVDSNRVTKRYNWRADDIDVLRAIHFKHLTDRR